ncbi:MAG: PIN domain-containing protein [Leptolyngbyaceae cyanobacterium SM1_4_3]|nr:PIN domain-containing protein [Leptolyngbyaceae cyanobacterium SM1_4_3]NJN90320.1 PIN domain-containing protein [Leptolyngbyaceae cyanobacterium SL_5_14]
MRVLVDTNIVLDFLLQREPFSQNAEMLFQAIDKEEVVGYITATTLTDIFYIARRHTRDVEQARQAVSETLTAMAICPVDRTVLELAFDSGLNDFEDAVQIFSAVTQGLDAIVTRDAQGFLSSPISVLSVQELLQQVKQQNGG